MTRARLMEEQIIAVLKEHEDETRTGDLARKPGMSGTTLYNRKVEFGWVDVSEARRLKEGENAKLKKLLVGQMLDARRSGNRCQKNGRACRQASWRHASGGLVGLSERRACFGRWRSIGRWPFLPSAGHSASREVM
jgi:putative transposase